MTEREWAFGIHAVTAVLKKKQRKVNTLYIDHKKQDKSLQTIIEMAKQQAIPVLSIQKISNQFEQNTHQGVIAEVGQVPEYHENDMTAMIEKADKQVLILILDGLTDVHNLGACLRSADAAGVDFVMLPKDKSAPVNATVSKVACGAAETVPIVPVTNLARAMKRLRDSGVWIFGAAAEGQRSLYQLDYTGHTAIVMGSEGKGLRRLTREHCDELYHIPMLGQVESLNVSVAAGVSLYEVVRQRSLSRA